MLHLESRASLGPNHDIKQLLKEYQSSTIDSKPQKTGESIVKQIYKDCITELATFSIVLIR